MALEGLALAALPDIVKSVLAEAPKGLLIAAGVIEAGAAAVLLALLISGKL